MAKMTWLSMTYREACGWFPGLGDAVAAGAAVKRSMPRARADEIEWTAPTGCLASGLMVSLPRASVQVRGRLRWDRERHEDVIRVRLTREGADVLGWML